MALKILSIDGGGTRGLIPATILKCIQQDFGKSPVEIFDLFAGTSTGGIICIALAAGIPVERIVDLYLNKSSEIFHESFLDRLSGLDEHLQANYQNKRFKKILTDPTFFGDKKLSDIHKDPNFGKKGKNLMVCSFNLSPDSVGERNKNYRPEVFHSEYISCKDVSLADLALMTSAGPTYFPIYNNHIDGGVAMNNPSMAAIAFAVNDDTSGKDYLYPDGKNKGLALNLRDLKLFSLSTGTGNKNRIEKSEIKTGNWGDIQWIKYLPDLITESNVQSTIYYVRQVLKDNQVYRVDIFFDDDNAPDVLKHGISMDNTQPEVLQGMHDYAVQVYNTQKDDIAKYLGLK